MRKLLILLLSLLLPFAAQAKKDAPLRYDIQPAGVGAEGMSLVRLSLYVESPKDASEDKLKKAAVHGIIFRGMSESGVTGFGNQPALVSSPAAAQQHGDFFESFFQPDGGYMTFANIVGPQRETVKTGKKEYRVTATVNVSTDKLRRFLREAKVIGRLTDGF